MKPKIGFIGVGIMGRHMASHLLEAGYQVVAYDAVPEATDFVVAKGAEPGGSCRDVAERSDLVISMVPDSPDVEQVALGEDGIVEAARAGLIYVDMSTIAPGVAVEVAEVLGLKGVRCLDAPVSGGEQAAIEGTLSFMVGGPEDVFAECRPFFETIIFTQFFHYNNMNTCNRGRTKIHNYPVGLTVIY